MAIRKGDQVEVTTDEFNFTPSGRPNEAYAKGTVGKAVRFRGFGEDRKLTVELKDGTFADWSASWIAKVDN